MTTTSNLSSASLGFECLISEGKKGVTVSLVVVVFDFDLGVVLVGFVVGVRPAVVRIVLVVGHLLLLLLEIKIELLLLL